jgi:protein TonB
MVHGLAIVALLSLGGKIAPVIPRSDRTPLYLPQDIREDMTLIQPERGGGGGGDGSPIPASFGKAPRFALEQLAPPEAVVRAVDPKLEVDPTLLGPPQLKLPSLDVSMWGDPNSKSFTPSNGPGRNGGIGPGDGGGIGPGKGPGLGPGDSGFGPATIHVVTGATPPIPIFRVEPEFTDAARKAKYQGTVEITIIVDADGNVRDARVAKAAGLGLDERALEAVKQWKFKPGMKDGKAVPVYAQVDVTFRLL